MQYLYAALLLHKAEQNVTATSLKKVLKAAGVEADDARVKTIVASLGEIDIEEAIASAASMAVAAPAAAGSSGGAAPAEEAVEEEEEEEEEGEVVEDDDGLGALFG